MVDNSVGFYADEGLHAGMNIPTIPLLEYLHLLIPFGLICLLILFLSFLSRDKSASCGKNCGEQRYHHSPYKHGRA